MFAQEEDTVVVGQDLLKLELGGAPPENAEKEAPTKEEPKAPADSKQEPGSKAAPPKEEREAPKEEKKAPAPPPPAPKKEEESKPAPPKQQSSNEPFGQREERRVSGKAAIAVDMR